MWNKSSIWRARGLPMWGQMHVWGARQVVVDIAIMLVGSANVFLVVMAVVVI